MKLTSVQYRFLKEVLLTIFPSASSSRRPVSHNFRRPQTLLWKGCGRSRICSEVSDSRHLPYCVVLEVTSVPNWTLILVLIAARPSKQRQFCNLPLRMPLSKLPKFGSIHCSACKD